jgi:hypothetical protein
MQKIPSTRTEKFFPAGQQKTIGPADAWLRSLPFPAPSTPVIEEVNWKTPFQNRGEGRLHDQKKLRTLIMRSLATSILRDHQVRAMRIINECLLGLAGLQTFALSRLNSTESYKDI